MIYLNNKINISVYFINESAMWSNIKMKLLNRVFWDMQSTYKFILQMPYHSRPRFCTQNTSTGAWLSWQAHEVFCSQSQVLFEAKCQPSPWPAWENPTGMGMRVVVNTICGQHLTEPPSFSSSGECLCLHMWTSAVVSAHL